MKRTKSLIRIIERTLKDEAKEVALKGQALDKRNRFNKLKYILSPDDCIVDTSDDNLLGLLSVYNYVTIVSKNIINILFSYDFINRITIGNLFC